MLFLSDKFKKDNFWGPILKTSEGSTKFSIHSILVSNSYFFTIFYGVENLRFSSPQHDELEHNWKKSSTESEYGVWKLLSCSFTYQSQNNPFP